MTPLEFIGIGALATLTLKLITGLRRQAVANEFREAFEEQIQAALREAFEAGALTAADMVTMSGEEELAGRIRKVIEHTSASNDN